MMPESELFAGLNDLDAEEEDGFVGADDFGVKDCVIQDFPSIHERKFVHISLDSSRSEAHHSSLRKLQVFRYLLRST
jgi:hypothetical protein